MSEELREKAKAATPGEWPVKENTGWDEAWCDWHEVGPLSFMGGKLNPNSAYIAAANPAAILALLDERDRLLSANEGMRKALARPFCVLFLDGRNEHGSHVLPSFPRSFDVNDEDLSEQAEAILKAAEAKGFVVGEDHVWAEFAWVEPQIGDEGRIELDGYWDFSGINVDMTRALLSSPALNSKLAPAGEGEANG